MTSPVRSVTRNHPALHTRKTPRRAHQSLQQEPDPAKRKAMVWNIERILVEDVARPIIFHNIGATCWHPHFKGHVQHENSIYNNWRFEHVWLDK